MTMLKITIRILRYDGKLITEFVDEQRYTMFFSTDVIHTFGVGKKEYPCRLVDVAVFGESCVHVTFKSLPRFSEGSF